MTRMLRGQVWLVQPFKDVDPKYYVVVSHNARNKNFDTVLAARITTSNKNADLATVATLPTGECLTGWVVADSLTELWDDDCLNTEPHGAFSAIAMKSIEEALKAALGIRR